MLAFASKAVLLRQVKRRADTLSKAAKSPQLKKNKSSTLGLFFLFSFASPQHIPQGLKASQQLTVYIYIYIYQHRNRHIRRLSRSRTRLPRSRTRLPRSRRRRARGRRWGGARVMTTLWPLALRNARAVLAGKAASTAAHSK